MENDSFFDQFIANESDCNEDVLRYIINAMDDETVQALSRRYEISSNMSLELYRRLHRQQYTPKPFHKNESVDQLLAWYNDQQSKKVDYARKQLEKRFNYFSFDEQNLIIETLLRRCNITDTAYCCTLMKNEAFWQDKYLPLIESYYAKVLNGNHNNAYCAARLMAMHSSKECIRSCIKDLDKPDIDEVLRLSLQIFLASQEEEPSKLLKNVVLRPEEYVYVMAKKGLKATREEAALALDAIQAPGLYYDHRRKAIIWSVAQMGYFDLLLEFGVKHKKGIPPYYYSLI